MSDPDFDLEKFDGAAKRGEVAFCSVIILTALRSMATVLERIAAKAQVDVATDLANVQTTLDGLRLNVEDLVGWHADER